MSTQIEGVSIFGYSEKVVKCCSFRFPYIPGFLSDQFEDSSVADLLNPIDERFVMNRPEDIPQVRVHDPFASLSRFRSTDLDVVSDAIGDHRCESLKLGHMP